MGLLNDIHPRPDVAILAAAGQPCVNGDGYTGTANDFILDCLERLGQPRKVRFDCAVIGSSRLVLIAPVTVGRLVLARSITSATSANRYVHTRGASRTRDKDQGHDAGAGRSDGIV
jgi:hypothetical protein